MNNGKQSFQQYLFVFMRGLNIMKDLHVQKATQHLIYKHLNHWSNIHLNLISFNVNWMRLGTGVSDADDPHPMMRIGSERRIIVASMSHLSPRQMRH